MPLWQQQEIQEMLRRLNAAQAAGSSFPAPHSQRSKNRLFCFDSNLHYLSILRPWITLEPPTRPQEDLALCGRGSADTATERRAASWAFIKAPKVKSSRQAVRLSGPLPSNGGSVVSRVHEETVNASSQDSKRPPASRTAGVRLNSTLCSGY